MLRNRWIGIFQKAQKKKVRGKATILAQKFLFYTDMVN
jgi:hypothetical protein